MLITSISAANPTVVTVAGHNAVTGQVVALDDTNSTPALSGDYVVTVLNANTFTVPVNVTGAGNAGNAYPVLFCDYESGVNANSGITYALRVKDATNGLTAARLFPGYQCRFKASPDPTSLAQSATWTDGPLAATFAPTSSTNATPIVFTKVGHILVTGDTVIVAGHTSNTNANGVWDVTVSGDTFTLLNADGSNSEGNGVGGASGTVRKITNSVVKLTTPVAKNIASCGNRNSVNKAIWVASANVSTSVNGTSKEGYGNPHMVIAAGFTTGLAAYFPTGTLDLSTYQQVSFWILQQSGTLGAASSCSLALCSDTAGTTVVNTINIPALGALNYWSPITVDLGSALGSSIQSIAFIVNTDNGAQIFLLDNIIACKSSSAADSLSLTSLIGKNTGTEGWYGIQSINGTRVVLDQHTGCIPATAPSRGYSGTTETVETWKRETIKTVMQASGATWNEVKDSGAEGNLITFSGGWNRTDMSTKTGETILDGQNGAAYALYTAAKSFLSIEMSSCRWVTGFTITGGSNVTLMGSCTNMSGEGVFLDTAHSTTVLNNCNNNLSTGVSINGSAAQNCTVNINSSSNNISTGCGINTSNNTVVINKTQNNGSYGVSPGNFNKITVLSSKGNVSGSVSVPGGIAYLNKSVLDSTVKIGGLTAFNNAFLWSTNENNNTDTHFGYTDGGLISSDVTTVHTEGGMSWKLSPTSTNRSASYPLPLKVATGATAANTPITCNVWFRRDNTSITARLVCKGGQLTGVNSDISSSMTAAANMWELLSVSATPTQRGVLEFTAEAYGGTSYNCWTTEASFS